MTQTIDPEKLKAAAEHLEWVLSQYPEEPVVQGLFNGLRALIEAAKGGSVREPLERVPFGYQFGDGEYRDFRNPSVDDAYARFATALEGGHSVQEIELIERIREIQAARRVGGTP